MRGCVSRQWYFTFILRINVWALLNKILMDLEGSTQCRDFMLLLKPSNRETDYYIKNQLAIQTQR